MRAIAICAALTLCGCVSLPASTPPPVIPAPGVPCVQYTPVQETALGNALADVQAAKPADAKVIAGFLTDYHNMRAVDPDPSCKQAQ